MSKMLRSSAPYFGVSFFIVLYLQVDAVVISLVVESEEVLGWYSIYDKLAGTLMFVPTVFMTAMYPSLSRLYADAPDGHNRLTQRSFELMLLIGVPLGLGLSAVAGPLVQLMFGSEYKDAASVLAVGGIVTSLTYLTTILGMFLISMDRQKEWTRFIALGAVLTIPLDFILVPLFQTHFDNGAIGGAVAYLITEAIVLTSAIALLPRNALGPRSLLFTVRVVAAGLVMVGIIYPLRNSALPVQVVAGAVAYATMVFLLQLITAEDRKLIRSILPGAPK
jgi:O-antigen/teichoic acid export membrane protein